MDTSSSGYASVPSDSSFKVPALLPQDLSIIQDIIGPLPSQTPILHTAKTESLNDDSIASSSDDESASDEDSENEVKAEILDGLEYCPSERPLKSEGPAEPSPDSSDSDSSVEDEIPFRRGNQPPVGLMMDADEDEDGESGVPTASAVLTKNEVVEVDFNVPEIDEVSADEELERVGYVMSVVNNVVIVRGTAAESLGRMSEKALDADTLLVFEDRKVLGYVYETFGPTSQPFYQVRFGEKYPLSLERVSVGRPVFYLPRYGKFVFVSELRRLKGSDASNVHDEEPAEYELEFSDDEEEAAHRARMKQQRQGSQAPSSSSRYSTPIPSQMRDSDMAAEEPYGSNPYDAHGIYDDLGAGPSRAAPLPYDDPYSDSFGIGSPIASASGSPPRFDDQPQHQPWSLGTFQQPPQPPPQTAFGSDMGFGGQGFVPPHINPRFMMNPQFAAQMGLSMGWMQQQQQQQQSMPLQFGANGQQGWNGSGQGYGHVQQRPPGGSGGDAL
ncbi:Gar1/Naf1 RNA binding region-domain-containing protein [Vararia minispora EC-137]|uniref:Gar1/Naf1 RNA binding region-domain-containing protein n=1 Tax=Vararia minispora EC-137 TaxID=1314806 RepID=A0ACB8QRH2_9AGAM|nr:Gar1/Naf1 RNA binding region-domain-containing protein [Vararia minispora EC-137]